MERDLVWSPLDNYCARRFLDSSSRRGGSQRLPPEAILNLLAIGLSLVPNYETLQQWYFDSLFHNAS